MLADLLGSNRVFLWVTLICSALFWGHKHSALSVLYSQNQIWTKLVKALFWKIPSISVLWKSVFRCSSFSVPKDKTTHIESHSFTLPTFTPCKSLHFTKGCFLEFCFKKVPDRFSFSMIREILMIFLENASIKLGGFCNFKAGS